MPGPRFDFTAGNGGNWASDGPDAW
jgi:hypothetical protein